VRQPGDPEADHDDDEEEELRASEVGDSVQDWRNDPTRRFEDDRDDHEPLE
jgi:hypothetical protein